MTAPLSVREQRMLLAIIELEQTLADERRDGLMETEPPVDADAQATLHGEQMYAMGYATAISSIRKILEEVING